MRPIRLDCSAFLVLCTLLGTVIAAERALEAGVIKVNTRYQKVDVFTSGDYLDVVGDGGWANSCYAIRPDGGVDVISAQGQARRWGQTRYTGISAAGNGDPQTLWAVHDDGVDRLHKGQVIELFRGQAYVDIAGDFYRRHAIAARKDGGLDVFIFNGRRIVEGLLPEMQFTKLTRHGRRWHRFWALTDDGVYHLKVEADWRTVAVRKVLEGKYLDIAAEPRAMNVIYVLEPAGRVLRVTVGATPDQTRAVLSESLSNVKALGDWGGWIGTGSRWGGHFYAVTQPDSQPAAPQQPATSP